MSGFHDAHVVVLAHGGERLGDGLAALQQGVQPVRLLLQELDSLHLHPEHHPHLTLQARELVCREEETLELKEETQQLCAVDDRMDSTAVELLLLVVR